MVVINGFAVTATVIVTGPDEVEDDPELPHALNASELADTTPRNAMPLRLLRRISTVPP
ncbi:MAG TPA: hypothetical protein VF933_07760 [Streptosporangiaceae bacterium]